MAENSTAVEALGFNMLKVPLNDSRVREAISYALDYDSIINAGFAHMLRG